MRQKPQTLIVSVLGLFASIALAAHTVLGQVEPTGGQQLQPRAYFPIVRKSPPVLNVVVGYEVSQGIQRPDNGVPLVSNRPTIVRVTLTSTVAHTNVSAWLHAFVGNIELPGSPIPALNNPRTLKAMANREWITDTFNFRPPTSWLNGSVTFRVRASNGADYWAQSQAQTFTFSPVPPLHVTVVPIHYTCTSGGSGTNVPASPYDYLVNNFTRKVYPVPTVTLQVRSPVAYSGPCSGGVPNPTFGDWIDMLDAVTAAWQADGSPVRYYYGLLNVYCLSGCIAGMAWLGGYRAAVGFTGFGPQHEEASETHAHEVAHNHEVEHTPGCGASNPYPNYPYLDASSRARIGNAAFPNFGLDVFSNIPTVYPYYANVFDYMSYCSPVWTSDFVYNAIRNYALIYNNAADMLEATEAAPRFLVSGQLAEDNAQLDPLFVLEAATNPTAQQMAFDNPAGVVELDLLDEQGSVLATHLIPLRKLSRPSPEGRTLLAFNTTVPFAEGVRAARLRQGERVLAERVGGKHPPRLLSSVQRLEAASGEQVFAWGADHPNPQALRYLVRVSADGGQTWRFLALTDAPRITLDPNAAPELFRNGAPWLEVQASDGVRVATRRFAPAGSERLIATEGE